MLWGGSLGREAGRMEVTSWVRRPFIGWGVRSVWKATLQRKVYNETLISQKWSPNGKAISCI